MKLISKLNLDKLYHYEGSLTTPPCSEIVDWIVVNDPQPISVEQLNLLNSFWGDNEHFNKTTGNGNNRLVQPLNGRTVYARNLNRQVPVAELNETMVLAENVTETTTS